jgi:membrane-bound lytic murein transglycosylase B
MTGDWRRGLAAGVAAAVAVFPPTAAAWWVLEADVGVVPPDDVLVEMTTRPAPPAPVTVEDYPTSRVAADVTAMPSASVTVVSFTSAEETVAPEQQATETPAAGAGGVRPTGNLGIPDLVLQAYQQASERLARSHPGCGVTWHLLAGIGKVESGHASGGRVDGSGRTHRPILGPRLDGVSTAAIRDTDGGALDGDTVWDRAVGPMQFIPGTWKAYGTDATGDGVADPHNVFDAALSAGRYLCAGGGDLTTEEGRIAALLRYNRSMSYVRTVLAWSEAYESGQVRSTPALPPGPAPVAGTTTPAPGSTTAPPSATTPPGATPTPTGPGSPTATPDPTATPSAPPEETPSTEPTPTPTETTPPPAEPEPTADPDPTAEPSETPTTEPSETPTTEPSETPTTEPSETPTTEQPTTEPTDDPTADPTEGPTP